MTQRIKSALMALVFIILMIGLLVLIAESMGALEVAIWFVILIVGTVTILRVGSRPTPGG